MRDDEDYCDACGGDPSCTEVRVHVLLAACDGRCQLVASLLVQSHLKRASEM